MTVYEYIETSKKCYEEFISENEKTLTEIDNLLIRKMFNKFILDMFSRGLSGGLLQGKMKIESED